MFRKRTSNENKPMDAYNVDVRWLKDNKDDEVSILVSQYHYGFQVHRELEDRLERLGIEFEKRV